MIVELADPTDSNTYFADETEARYQSRENTMKKMKQYMCVDHEIYLVTPVKTEKTDIFYYDGLFMRKI